ncbi:hypothetical protein NPIL_554101, partial [Nephila pilipes]
DPSGVRDDLGGIPKISPHLKVFRYQSRDQKLAWHSPWFSPIDEGKSDPRLCQEWDGGHGNLDQKVTGSIQEQTTCSHDSQINSFCRQSLGWRLWMGIFRERG